jgi:hypothetical protein
MLPFLSLLATLVTTPIAAEAAPDPVLLAQLTIRERVIVRVPRMSAAAAPLPAPVRWAEKKGDKCLPMGSLAGALVSGPQAVDFVLIGGQRLRAKLDDDCHALDFYSGFYVRPQPDGMMCAGRDAVRTRSGGVCPIRQFRRLVPKH